MLSKKRKSTASDKIFHELAVRNVKKSAKDYFIYFITLMLAVCLFYSFNSVSTQFTSLGLEDRFNYLTFSSGVLTVFSVLVCFIMGALVVYANRFLLRRRKKEMGIYATLGMEQKDLNRILMKETYQIGVVSLAAGLVLGVFAAQILSLVTARLAGISLASYRFMVSGKAILLSIIFFGILFFFVHRFNVKELKKMSLLEMLYAERKNETVQNEKCRVEIITGIFSVILMAGGYAVIYFMADQSLFRALGIGSAMLIAGSIFFFESAFRVMAEFMKKNKNFYFRGLNMFTASQFASRMKSESRSIALVSVLLFLSLSLTILGTGTGKYVMNGIEYAAPYDGTIFCNTKNQAETSEEVFSRFRNTGVDINDFSDSYVSFRVYDTPSLTTEFLNGERTLEMKASESVPLNIIGSEDYNRMLAIQGEKPISLREDEFALSYAFPAMEEIAEAFIKRTRTLTLGGKTLTLADNGLYHHAWENKNVLVEEGTIIVPQKTAEELSSERWILNFNFSGNKEEAEKKFYESWFHADTEEFMLFGGQETIISITADNLLMTYLGIYLGITFLITAGAVLALQQLSQSSDNIKRYRLLGQLGASRKEMKGSLIKQLKIYFGLPMLVAAIHAGVVVTLIFRYFEGLACSMIVSIVGFGVLMVILVYAVYVIATYTGSRRILQL